MSSFPILDKKTGERENQTSSFTWLLRNNVLNCCLKAKHLHISTVEFINIQRVIYSG